MKVAWLEQSGILEDRDDFVAALSKMGIDYFRLNWHTEDDPFAEVKTKHEKVSWSKGREQLYFAACKRDYDYYIFADDDLRFEGNLLWALSEILTTLKHFKPEILMARSDSDWQERLIEKTLTGVVPVFLLDLQFQCYSKGVAEFAFPTQFDGGWGTLWYPMLAVNKKPGHVLSNRDLKIHNTRRSLSGHYGGVDNRNTESIWARSRPFMSDAVFNLSKKIGVRQTVEQLNKLFSSKYHTKTGPCL
jgi:hypothetical protein